MLGSKEEVIVIKAQEHRSQEQNRESALKRLQELIYERHRNPQKAQVEFAIAQFPAKAT